MEIELWKLMGQLRVDGVGCPGREEEVDGGRVGAEPQGFTVEMEGKAGPSCLGRWVYDPPRCLLAFLVSQKGLLLS